MTRSYEISFEKLKDLNEKLIDLWEELINVPKQKIMIERWIN